MKNKYLVFIVPIFLFVQSCTYDKYSDIERVTESGYPEDVANILVNKCATAGCHNTQSKNAAAGLDLSTWNKMFEGGKGGACVIPYRTDYSLLMYYTNTDSTQGLALKPTMPYNAAPLTASEYAILKNWVQSGAPDKTGFIKFSDNPQRPKFYVANQGCDVVTVFDMATNLAMRYVNVGVQHSTEVPHMIKVSPDNQYWYTIFYSGSVIQKFRTSDNSHVADVSLGLGSWNTFAITSDSKKAIVVDWSFSGKVAYVDIENMTVIQMWTGFDLPHGSALNHNGDTAYVTAQYGNFIYKIPVNDPGNMDRIVLNPPANPTSASSLDPHEITFSPDFSKYYVTCQKSNQVRVMQTANDSLLAVIPTGEYPVEMAVSKTKPYLFVSCMNHTNLNTNVIGKVDIINTNTNSVIKSIITGHQPHGLALSDAYNKIYVTNRNAIFGGPAPHHSSVCGGRNGSVTAIDLSTLELVPNFKTEVSVDPYGIGITH